MPCSGLAQRFFSERWVERAGPVLLESRGYRRSPGKDAIINPGHIVPDNESHLNIIVDLEKELNYEFYQ